MGGNKFDIGDSVYIVTDPEQHKRTVSSYTVNPGNIVYAVVFIGQVTYHYDFEISKDKDVLKCI
mgnify:CR=1 FL=1